MDLADAPDLFPPLTALACFCEGTTLLEGVDRLRHKESDRAAALVEEFGRLGADLRIEGLNRITLFALIFSIGILVDDAIVVVENIVRHFHLPANRGRGWTEVAVEAVSEVGNPTILATFAVIAAVVPMAFVGGLMGPYMRPIPIGASAAMIVSLVVAFIVTPWEAVRVLAWGQSKGHAAEHSTDKEGWSTRIYRRLMGRLIHEKKTRHLFMVVNAILLAGAMGLVAIGWVQVKMLPFDNKNFNPYKKTALKAVFL